MGKAADEIDSEQFGPERRLQNGTMRWAKSTAAAWADVSVVGGMEMTGCMKGLREPRTWDLPASIRLNPSFTNDGAVFLMVSDNHFAKLVTIAKIDIKSKRRHTLLDVGKLGGLTNGLTDAGDDFR